MTDLSWLLRSTRAELGPTWPLAVVLGAVLAFGILLGLIWAVEVLRMVMGAA